MSYLLRKFSYSKWSKNKGLEPDFFNADSITGCTRTLRNKLSLWVSDTKDYNSEYVEKIIVALATTMPAPDTIDLVWLEEEWFHRHNMPLELNVGNSEYESVNDKHRDVAELTHHGLALFGAHLMQQLENKENYSRINKSKLIALVDKWMQQEKEFNIDDLGEKWREPLEKLHN